MDCEFGWHAMVSAVRVQVQLSAVLVQVQLSAVLVQVQLSAVLVQVQLSAVLVQVQLSAVLVQVQLSRSTELQCSTIRPQRTLIKTAMKSFRSFIAFPRLILNRLSSTHETAANVLSSFPLWINIQIWYVTAEW